jgi:protein transport protein SEC13
MLNGNSVNSVSWAPHELGAILACASSDGKISVLTFKGEVLHHHPAAPPQFSPSLHILTELKCIDDGQWGADVFEAHAIGCNAVSWAPAARAGSLLAAPNASGARSPPVKRFASAGCDNIVKIWGFSEETQAWVEEDVLEGHADWVRDVAWAPNIGLPRSYIATASQVSS